MSNQLEKRFIMKEMMGITRLMLQLASTPLLATARKD
jgi:hypothetical protein